MHAVIMVEFRKFLLVVCFIQTLLFSVTVGNHSTICLESFPNSTSTTNGMQFSCGTRQWIRIDYIEVYKSNNPTSHSNTCSSDGQSWEIHDDEFQKLNHFIHIRCSYYQFCQLGDSVYTPSGLNQTMWQLGIGYTCIHEVEFLNFCSSIDTVINGTLQLVALIETQSCFCIIPENINVTLVEYTPCNKDGCSNSIIYLNGEQQFDCTDCMYTTYCNVHINKSNTNTNITVENINFFMLFWISVTDNFNSNRRIRCNMDIPDFIQTSTSPEPTTTTTISTETSSVASTVTVDVSLTSTINIPTTPMAGDSEQQEFPLMSVVGGVVGSTVAIVIIIIVIICVRRRVQGRNEAGETSSQYDRVEFHVKGKPKTRSLTNESYEEIKDGKITDRNMKSNLSNCDTGHEQRENTIVENRNRLTDDHVSRTNVSVIYSKVNKLNKNVKSQPESDANDVNTLYAATYAEPGACYNGVDSATIKDNEKWATDVSEYDSFTVSDEYSHIHAARKYPSSSNTDNYSHITLPVDKNKTEVSANAGHETDSYNHIKINTDTQRECDTSDKGHSYNVEEDLDYDTCGRF